MIISGLRKLSTLDYPTKLCVTVFTKGCNFRCPFCHNSSLVLGEATDIISPSELLNFLKKRIGLIDAVCITGGEPLINNTEDVSNLLTSIKDLGFLTKLDTNGTFPQKLKSLLDEKLLDYVAMDIKNSPSEYAITAGTDVNIENVKKSVSLLMDGKVDFEFRTTVVKNYHNEQSMKEIGKWIQGTEKYFLQMYVPSENTIQKELEPYSARELENLRQAVLPFVPNTLLRGV